MLKGLQDFLVHDLICLSEVLTSLGMSDNNILNAKVIQHSRSDLACKSTLLFKIHILSADLDVRAFSCCKSCRKIDCRYAEENVNIIRCESSLIVVDERCCFSRSHIHFPVSCCEDTSCHGNHPPSILYALLN